MNSVSVNYVYVHLRAVHQKHVGPVTMETPHVSKQDHESQTKNPPQRTVSQRVCHLPQVEQCEHLMLVLAADQHSTSPSPHKLQEGPVPSCAPLRFTQNNHQINQKSRVAHRQNHSPRQESRAAHRHNRSLQHQQSRYPYRLEHSRNQLQQKTPTQNRRVSLTRKHRSRHLTERNCTRR